MRSRKPAQAGFPPASRDFSRQAASGTTLSHKVRRSATRNRHATWCAQRLSEPLEPFRLRRDRRACRRVIRIGSYGDRDYSSLPRHTRHPLLERSIFVHLRWAEALSEVGQALRAGSTQVLPAYGKDT